MGRPSFEPKPVLYAFCEVCRTLYVGLAGEGVYCHHHDTSLRSITEADPTKQPPSFIETRFARHIVDQTPDHWAIATRLRNEANSKRHKAGKKRLRVIPGGKRG